VTNVTRPAERAAGPRVFVEPWDAIPIVSVAVTFRSGAAFDPPGKDGLARVVARMLRRGAEGYTAQQIEETIDAMGGELAADVSVSAISVHFEVIRRSLDAMVDLCSTLLARPSFDERELSRLLRESEAELVEARDSDRALVSRAFRRTLFEGHPYGRRLSGQIPTLRTLGEGDVRAFYERHFCRANAIVIVSGDVTEAEGRALADRLLAKLPEGEAVRDPVPPPVQKRGRHLVFVDKPERTQTQTVMGCLGTDAHDPDHFALFVANSAFGGNMTSRLMQEIRVKRGWSYGASSRVGFDRQRDAFSIWTTPKDTDAPACLALELDLYHAFREEGVTDEELTLVKRYLVRSHAFDVDTARKRVHQKLEADLYDLPPGYHDRYVDHVQGVDQAAANAAAKARLSEDDLVIAVVGTHAEIGDAVAKAVPRLDSVTVAPFDLE
jgi:zinc protease